MHEQIKVEALQVGMFVAELDRPWLDTPFLFQGFLIESDEQIQELCQCCGYVMVDPLRSIGCNYWDNTPQHQEARRRLAILDRREPDTYTHLAPLPLDLADRADGPFARNRNRYPDQTPLEEELPQAKQIHLHAEQAVQHLFDELQQHGTTDLNRAHEVMDGMVESIIRNPDALALLSRVKRASAYVYGRSVSVAINMLLFGRHLGFPRDHMHLLGAAGLLLDVGTAKVPPEILRRRQRLPSWPAWSSNRRAG